MHELTQEQKEIISFITSSNSSLIVNALAGAAKTTTLIEVAKALTSIHPHTSILSLAFNSRIKKELEARLPTGIQCLTLNSLGHRSWMTMVRGKITLDQGKNYSILRAAIQGKKLKLEKEEFSQILEIISSAKVVGVVPQELSSNFHAISLQPDNLATWERLFTESDLPFSEQILALVKDCLKESVSQAYRGVIDFDDQLYMSVCFNSSYVKFPIILVDEAQDLSPINLKQIVKSLSPEGRVIAFGDRHQSIYAFRGADPQSMARIKSQFSSSELPLTTTFRCDRKICDLVRPHVGKISPRDGAGEGEILIYPTSDFSLSSIPAGSAVLCRNNAPLLRVASACLARRIPVKVLGKEIGKSLSRILHKFDQNLSGKVLQSTIKAWAQGELSLCGGNHAKKQRIIDRYDCLSGLVETNFSLTAGKLCDLIHEMFSDSSALITFATGHKSKGLEFPSIIHLEQKLIGEGEQEANLNYVINTRAKHKITFLNLKQIKDLSDGTTEI